MTVASKQVPGWQGESEKNGEAGKFDLRTLSEMTGFPSHFIKSELLLEEEELSVEDLRSKMLSYLESANQMMQEKGA